MADSGSSGGPRDAAVMEAILKEMGVEEYEPNVVHQMLEFSYRYITNILEDARVYSEHAQKKELDVSDVKLAVQTRMDHSFTTPPPRDFLIEVAREKNSAPLPLIPEKFGPRLPPERYCLTANNYKLKERHKPPSLSKPQVTLSSTFRLPLKQTTSTASSSLRSQLTSPLLQSTGASGTSKVVMLTGTGTKQQGTGAKQSMPTLGSLGGGQARGNNSSSNNNTQTLFSSNGITLSMPTINQLK